MTNKKVAEWLEVESENWIDLEEYPGVFGEEKGEDESEEN